MREMDRAGISTIETNLDEYVAKMQKSIKGWKGKKPIPNPPDFTVRTLIRYAISKAQ